MDLTDKMDLYLIEAKKKRVSLKQETSKWYIKAVDDQDRIGAKVTDQNWSKRDEAKKAAEKAGYEVVSF